MKTLEVRSLAGLERALARIESHSTPKPDWIDLKAGARIERWPRTARAALLSRLHAAVLRGFHCAELELGRRARLALWREIAAHGFHDFGGRGWRKHYDSPWVESYDYVADYLRGGLDALDPYQVYAAVLGTHDYGVEDFVHTELGAGTRTVVEPMAGSAELSYGGHFRHPDFRYVMFDLDATARDHVLAKPWLPDSEHHYLVADVLDEEIWKQVKSLSSGRSLGYIGKQSHHFFGARDLLRLLELATRYLDVLVLEVPPPSLASDLPDVDDLTRTEMHDAGFHVELVDEPDGSPNPITHRMAFRLDAWDRHARRTLFRYPGWTSWPTPTLAFAADLLGVELRYFHSERLEFVPPEVGVADADLDENVTFIALSRSGR